MCREEDKVREKKEEMECSERFHCRSESGVLCLVRESESERSKIEEGGKGKKTKKERAQVLE